MANFKFPQKKDSWIHYNFCTIFLGTHAISLLRPKFKILQHSNSMSPLQTRTIVKRSGKKFTTMKKSGGKLKQCPTMGDQTIHNKTSLKFAKQSIFKL